MTHPKEQLTQADYAEAFESNMPTRLRCIFGELKAATRTLADAARCYAIIEAEYVEEKEKVLRANKKKKSPNINDVMDLYLEKPKAKKGKKNG